MFVHFAHSGLGEGARASGRADQDVGFDVRDYGREVCGIFFESPCGQEEEGRAKGCCARLRDVGHGGDQNALLVDATVSHVLLVD